MGKPKPNPAWRFLAKHGEKVGLAVAVLALSSVLIGQLAAKEDPNLERLDLALRKADASFSTPRPEDLPPRPKAWETSAVAPWNSVSTARGADDWSASLLSELRGREIIVAGPKPRRVLAPSVELGKVQAQLDGVALDWSVREFTADEKAKGRKEGFDYVDLSSFAIERETSGSGRWEPLATLDPKAQSFRDAATEPLTLYRYRVTATSAAPATSATSDPVKTPGLWRLEYRSPSDGKVQVLIEKYEKALGRKVELLHLQEAGERIGWWPEPGNPAPTSKHRVQVGTKSVEVDFDTGTTLVSVTPKKLALAVKRCDRTFDPKTGLVTGCVEVVEKQPHSTVELVLQGPAGRETLLMPPPGAVDRRCKEHAK